MAINEQFPSLMPTLCPGSMATDPKPYASLDKRWRRLAKYQIIRLLPSTAKNKLFACFFVGSAVIRSVGAPVLRPLARPRPSAVSDAFMADGIER